MTNPIRYDLKTGYPHLDVVPREQLSELAAELFTRDRPLQYVGDMRGDTWTREQIGNLLTSTSTQTVTVPDLQITGGAISATDQVARYATKPGDIALVENPTFYFIIHKLEINHLEVMGVPMQSDGVDLDALEAICEQHGDRISMFYVISSFHNPTGVNTSTEKRKKLIELAQRYDFTIVEDATYQLLYYNQDAPPPPMIRELDTESGHVITVGSFAKLIMPSLRIGWIWATPQQIDELLPYKATATSVFMSQLVGEMINTDRITPQIDHARAVYGRKHDIMHETFQQHAPDWFQWTAPQGGYFIWATLPEHLKASDVLAAANAHGVDFAEGRRAFVRAEAPDRYMRICFAMQDDDMLREGSKALCDVLNELG